MVEVILKKLSNSCAIIIGFHFNFARHASLKTEATALLC